MKRKKFERLMSAEGGGGRRIKQQQQHHPIDIQIIKITNPY